MSENEQNTKDLGFATEPGESLNNQECPYRKAMTCGDRVTAEHAKNLLEKRFTGQEERKTKSKKLTVLLVDELDMLWNRFEI